MASHRHPSGQATAVVLALAEEPATWRYGYELCQRLDLAAGELYKTLMRLADRGLLETSWELEVADRPPRQRYRLSGSGVALAEGLATEPPVPPRAAWAVGAPGAVAGGHMNRTKRIGRVGGLAAAAIAATPFAYLWVFQVTNAKEPPTAEVRLDIAIWMAVFAMPAMLAAWLLWRAWWRQAGARVSALDGPGLLLAAATATLPADRRDWGAAMAAELAQVQDRAARWRFAAGCASAAVFPPGSNRAAVVVTGALAVGATTAAALVTGAALPAGRVFGLTFVGLAGGLVTLMVARPRRVGEARPGPAVAGLALAGVAGCAAFTTYYLAEYPSYPRTRPPTDALSLPPVTAVVLAVVLAGCLWLALRPPRWLTPDRLALRFGIAMAIALVGGFLLESRLIQPGLRPGSQGMMGYLFNGPLLVILPGSVAAAVVGRSFRTGLGACVLALVLGAPLLVMAWLAEALPWYQQGRGLLLDGEGGLGVGANLGNAVWWSLIFLVLWALPVGVLGAAAGGAGTRLRRARKHAGPAPTS